MFQIESLREESSRAEASAVQQAKRMRSDVRFDSALVNVYNVWSDFQVEQLRSALAAADAANAALGEVSRFFYHYNAICGSMLHAVKYVCAECISRGAACDAAARTSACTNHCSFVFAWASVLTQHAGAAGSSGARRCCSCRHGAAFGPFLARPHNS